MIRAALAASFLCISLAAAAQSVQRCEGPGGQVTYSNTACPAGTNPVRKLDDAPGPSKEDQKAAQQRARTEAKEAERLQRQQTADDKKAASARAAEEKQAKAREAECKTLEQKLRYAQEDFDSAPLSKHADAQKKLRRAKEAHEGKCKS